MKYLIVASLLVAGTVFGHTFQQERQYHITLPAHLVNPCLMVIDGQLDQISAKDYRELTAVIQPQIYQQYRQYAKDDSIMAANLKPHPDTTKIKKP
jgi:hypothetical protein